MKSLAWMYFGSTLAGAALWALGWFVVAELATCHAQTVEVHATPTPMATFGKYAVSKDFAESIKFNPGDGAWGWLRMPKTNHTDSHAWKRPVVPDEVEAEIVTTDGKHWIAKWIPKP